MAIINLLAALFKAFPSLEKVIALAIAQADKGNVANAIKRKYEKDAAVDAAIDGRTDEKDSS